jgi:molybdenum cofactor biosynthesis protein B
MSVAEHKATSPATASCFVLTVSDSRTIETETSGKAIADLLEAAGHTVIDRQIARDEPNEVRRILENEVRRKKARVMITTGGTGITRRDSTHEALVGIFDKRLDGFGELFRMLSYQEIGSAAMMSRATAGIAGGCAIFLLPGSEAAVRLAMTKLILPELGHLMRELNR